MTRGDWQRLLHIRTYCRVRIAFSAAFIIRWYIAA